MRHPTRRQLRLMQLDRNTRMRLAIEHGSRSMITRLVYRQLLKFINL